MIAVLDDAIDCYRKYRPAKNARGRKLFRDTQEWFLCEQGSWLFSFESICKMLGLDPCCVRSALEVRG